MKHVHNYPIIARIVVALKHKSLMSFAFGCVHVMLMCTIESMMCTSSLLPAAAIRLGVR